MFMGTTIMMVKACYKILIATQYILTVLGNEKLSFRAKLIVKLTVFFDLSLTLFNSSSKFVIC